MRLVLPIILAAAASSADAQERSLANPESITCGEEHCFVSNIGEKLDATARDGDGFIARTDLMGELVAGPAIPKDGILNAPKGLALLEDVLYGVDLDRVVAFDPETGETRGEWPAPDGTEGLNDIAVFGDALLVTDFTGGRLLRLDPAKGFIVLAAGMPGANGVIAAPDGVTAYVAASGAELEGGHLYRVDLESGRVEPLGRETGIFDGITWGPEGKLIVTDWVDIHAPTPGRILSVNPVSGSAREISVPEPIISPADLTATAQGLLIPSMLGGQIASLSLD
ncbi:Vgb family protein [Paracoccus methylarcula]|uniref:SMP-30/Gluconolactonase/LRE-like region domain-containing protein n=1 Tax=Paracoccus methylarcula TaxID=72022 RepID=A0A3R7P3W4_9RHOB|nr:hypothetical protein [Paracoccus methylarcula]RNF34000.1 hypothetical protein A7A09_013940 [Paracoccus methylarcula]